MTADSQEVPGAGDLGPVLTQLAQLGRLEFTPQGVCEHAGVDRESADRLWRALGFPDVDEGQVAYSRQDARGLGLATEGLDQLDPEQRQQALSVLAREARSISRHLAAVTDIELAALAEMQQWGLRVRLLAQALEHGLAESDLGWLILYVIRRQLLARATSPLAPSPSGHQVSAAVGFVDLHAYSELTQQSDADELGQVLAAFDDLSGDVVAEAPGRVIKLIGDEVMFICSGVEQAASAALEIAAACRRRALPPAHGAVAAGTMLHQHGDYFGRPVNLAARAAALAPPNAIWIDSVSARQLSAKSFRLVDRDVHELKGIGAIGLVEVVVK